VPHYRVARAIVISRKITWHVYDARSVSQIERVSRRFFGRNWNRSFFSEDISREAIVYRKFTSSFQC